MRKRTAAVQSPTPIKALTQIQAEAEAEQSRLEADADVRTRLLQAEEQLNGTFIERQDVIRVMIVAHLIKQHYLLVGTPGTAKTAIATSFSRHILGCTYFRTMGGSFSSPDKIFGPLDIKKFQAGVYEHVLTGMLADVEFGFVDEFFKLNEATLNEMLTALNEREFMGKPIPLMTCGMATNWPEINMRTDNTNALYDRCLMRVAVSDVSTEEGMIKVLEAIDGVASYEPDQDACIDMDMLRHAQASVQRVTITPTIRKMMASIRNTLAFRMVGNKKKEGIAISSRRLGALQDALRASAWLDGRDEVSILDFGIMAFGLWNDRADLEHVKASLDTLDQLLVGELIGKIDAARLEYQSLTNEDFGTSRVTQVTETFARVIAEVKSASARPVFTSGGQTKIKKAMGKLVRDFKDMSSRQATFCEEAGI